MDWLSLAEREVFEQYGDRVSAQYKGKTLLKFGKYDALGTSWQTVQNNGGDETFVTTNAIDKFSSSSGSDTGAMVVEGHTVSGTGADSQFTFVKQTVTLAGQTETSLTTPLARVTRAYTSGSSPLVGDVYIYEDDTVTAGVPQTASKIHLKMLAGEQQSYKCSTTFSNSDYAFCTGGFVAVNKKTAATVDFELEVRLPGGVFRPQSRITAASTGLNTAHITLRPFVIIPKNADVRVRAIASTSSVEVNASISFILAKVRP